MFMCTLVCIIGVNVYGNETEIREAYSVMHAEMKKYIKGSEYLQSVNLVWPNSEVLNGQAVEKNTIASKSFKNAMHWIRYFIKRIDGLYENTHVLEEMKNGDDWIIGRVHANNYYGYSGYLQFIDGRYLDVIFYSDNDVADTSAFKTGFINNISDAIKVTTFLSSDEANIRIRHYTGETIEGEIDCVSSGYYCMLPENEEKPYFWTNGRVVVMSFPKVRKPLRNKFGYNAAWTVGGIPREDERAFIRFREKGIDFEEEMKRRFPWIIDSLNRE